MIDKLKQRLTTQSFLAGSTFGDWWRLLRENRFAVDPVYWHRAAFITVMSLLNSVNARKERRLYDAAVSKTEITKPPLFILGHWRSGTTHFHNLLALDTEQFAYANTYQVGSPYTFLSTEEVNAERFAGLLPETRPVDNVALSMWTPQEDEFALLLISFRSPYIGHVFPRRREYYDRYLTFRNVSKAEIEEWNKGLLWFMKKLTWKYERSLLLKSPPHTARIRLLLQLFPNARFVHLHRDPYRVFRSTQHLNAVNSQHQYLQSEDPPDVDYVLQRYNMMYDAYFEDRTLVPEAQFLDIRFEDVEQDPVGQVRSVYEKFNLSGFESLQPKLERYLESISGYKKNKYPELPAPLRHRIGQAWQRSFEEWNYPR
jgi:hypothetical protein